MNDRSICTPQHQTSFDVTQRVVAAIWGEVLQLPNPPDAADNFFAIGGDSMTMVMVEFRIAEELSVQPPPGSILSAPTLCELAALIEAMRNERPSLALDTPAPVPC